MVGALPTFIALVLGSACPSAAVGGVALRCWVVAAAGAAARLLPEPVEIAKKFSYLVFVEGWWWCVVGVAAGVGDLVWFNGRHCCVARHADIERVHWAQPVALK